MYSDAEKQLLELLGGKEKITLMVAPSFVVDFNYKTFVPLMKALGFDYVSELTFGAKIVNQNYHNYILENKNKQDFFISSTCPMCLSLIKSKFPDLVPFLLPFDSPMQSMAKIIKKNFKSKVVFLSPCNAKKTENSIVDLIITFKEMKSFLKKQKPSPAKVSHLFDSFYNDYTKIYPVSGGLSKTINKKGILEKKEMISKDGLKQITKILKKPLDKKFYDILFCQGGCICGPEVNSSLPSWLRKISVLSYLKQAKKEKIGSRKGLEKYSEGINFSRKFD
jgi:iron only hydrogenase large subunit-like protein